VEQRFTVPLVDQETDEVLEPELMVVLPISSNATPTAVSSSST